MESLRKLLSKDNKKLGKDGSIMIWTLFMLIIIFSFTGLFFSYINMSDNLHLADQTVETIGKTRVQAIDVPMKEQYGHIEVLHYGYTPGKYDYFDEELYLPDKEGIRATGTGSNAEKTPGYDNAIRNQDDPYYKSAVAYADNSAILTGIASLKNRIKNFDDGVEEVADGAFLSATADNFCIEVFPLPAGESEVIDSISCETDLVVDGDKVVVEDKNVKVNGLDHDLNNNLSADIENKKLKVFNAVFVGYAYEDRDSLFFKYFGEKFGIDPPVRTVHRIVYPQIDSESFESSGWN